MNIVKSEIILSEIYKELFPILFVLITLYKQAIFPEKDGGHPPPMKGREGCLSVTKTHLSNSVTGFTFGSGAIVVYLDNLMEYKKQHNEKHVPSLHRGILRQPSVR